jgi:hypothetical protein
MRFIFIVSVLWCISDLFAKDDSFQVDIGLKSTNYVDIYSNPYVTAIRIELTRYLSETSWRDSLEKANVNFGDHLIQDTTCVAYYADSFSVIHIWPGQFGGINGLIIFKHRPDKIFRIWVYKIDEGEYQLRQIQPQMDFTKDEINKLIRKHGERLFAKSI